MKNCAEELMSTKSCYREGKRVAQARDHAGFNSGTKDLPICTVHTILNTSLNKSDLWFVSLIMSNIHRGKNYFKFLCICSIRKLLLYLRGISFSVLYFRVLFLFLKCDIWVFAKTVDLETLQQERAKISPNLSLERVFRIFLHYFLVILFLINFNAWRRTLVWRGLGIFRLAMSGSFET